MNQEKIKDMEAFIEGLSRDKINEINKKEFEETKAQYEDFSDKFSKGTCVFCNSKLEVFNESIPCMHWLLHPNGFEKRHFKLIIENFNYSRIESYLRWIASQEAFLNNINDLTEERRGSMIFEYTIKYKDFVWSFSCSNGDFEGHKNSRRGTNSHYHFQMKIKDRQFINFSDFHIPLNQYDQFVIRSKRGEIRGVAHTGYFGAGVGDLFENLSPEEILKNSKVTEDYTNATINTSYFIEAEPGKTISGDDIADLMKESRETGTPLWNLLPKLKNIGTKKAIVSPGDGVVEISPRKGGRRKNEN